MRIDNNTYQYIGLGAMLKNNQKAANPILNDKQGTENVIENIDLLPVKGLGMSPFSNFMFVKNNISNEADDVDAEAVYAEIDDKMNKMEEFLKRLRIDGRVKEALVIDGRNSYTMYYIETNENSKNMVIIEFENGELSYAPVEESGDDCLNNFQRSTGLLLGKRKFSVDELKKAFAEHFNVDELNDFIYDFLFQKKEL